MFGILLSIASYFIGTILASSIFQLQYDIYGNFNSHSAYITSSITASKYDELKVKYSDVKISGFRYSSYYLTSKTDNIDTYTNWYMNLIGVEHDFYNYAIPSITHGDCIEQPELVLGRAFNSDDYLLNRKVIIMHYSIAKLYFPYSNPLGENIKMNNTSYQIVGLLKDTADVKRTIERMNPRVFDKTIKTNNGYTSAYIPNSYFGTITYYDRTILTFPDVDMESVYNMLIDNVYNNVDTGQLYIQKHILEDLQKDLKAVNNMILIAIMVMLILSGISLSTILSFSFKERIREIGIKKAIGATDSDILLQFFIEAILNGLLGGLSGMVVGLSIVLIIGPFFIGISYTTIFKQIHIQSFTVPLLLALLISVIFNFFPSILATRRNTIDAIRSE